MQDKVDLALIDEILSGKKESFKVIIEHYQSLVYHVALRMLVVKEDAEEATQDCFIKAYRQLKSFKREAKFSTWLYRIAYNTCIDMTKSKHRKYQMQSTAIKDETLLIGTVVNDKKNIDFDVYFQKLPSRFRQIILLFYYNDYSYQEIAEIMDESIGNVKTLLFRARKELKNMMSLEKIG